MYQKDYILRMIEMIAEVIAKIIGLILKKDTKQASLLLENAYQNFLKKDASFFRNLPKEKLTDELLAEHDYTNGHLQILAELFFAEGELQCAKGNNESSFTYYEKSLVLLRFIEKESRSFSLTMESKKALIEEKITKLKSSIS